MDSPSRSLPVHAPVILGEGRFRSVVTPTGTGCAWFGDYLLTGWQDDPCLDEHGLAFILRDVEAGAPWSACGTPVGAVARRVSRLSDGVQLDSTVGDLHACVTVSVQGDAETRTLHLTNTGSAAQTVEITAVCEVVLNPPDHQDGHPAFGKLFVQTAWDAAQGRLIATRRARGKGDRHPALALRLTGAAITGLESDRVRWRGRGRMGADADGLRGALSGTTGNVLDPVLALRTVITVAPGETGVLVATLSAADSVEALGQPARGHAAVGEPREWTDAAVPDALRRRLAATSAAVGRAAPLPVRQPGSTTTVTRPANGYGGFVDGADEYRIVLTRRADGALDLPPMPWCQVLANEHDFGALLSEKGSMTTFNGNSRLHRLTPWRNDPVEDPHDEAFFVRDEDTGAFASLLPGPAPGADVYEVRHGLGYSTFTHVSLGLAIEATVVVPTDAPVRILSLSIHNGDDRERHLSLYQLATLVQGGTPHETRSTIQVSVDAARGCVTAVNPAAGVFAGRVLFTAFSGLTPADASIDRRVVLGCPGSTLAPLAVVAGGALEVGEPGEAMAAQRALLTLPAGATHTCAMLLGEVADVAALDALLARFTPAGVAEAIAQTRATWAQRLSGTRIQTPVAALDRVVNGWLGYQTIVCRLWARSAYYQSGGAYGFRDQLQDASSLALDAPEMLRAQILRNAAHQFEAGDVLHWWHPPESVGIRTRFADDLVWLPYLTAHYLNTTGDLAVLDEVVGFRSGPELADGEDEHYFKSLPAASAASVYEHCARALQRGMTIGRNGLPLFGCGDWNDGMNRVGREGRGESTWMGFFLVSTIDAFLPYAVARGDAALVAAMHDYRARMVTALNDTGWDGGWYRRGYYDSGAPLGSKDSDECRIDALAQAWAVISGVAPRERIEQALDAMQRELVSYDDRLVRLLAPPFVNTAEDPGYIKGYVAGVRENGGQYTHAALWAAKALLLAGRRDAGARVLAMLSPVSHTATPSDVARYQVEPYVIAADVYGVAPHVGRGGWTWYTGSAGWMLRVTLENLLGITVEGGHSLRVAPLIPDSWTGFTVEHRRPDGTRYVIVVETQGGAGRIQSATLDESAVALEDGCVVVPLCQDGGLHTLRVAMGPAA